jgi:two-component system LytT family sensor kinase
MQRALGRGVVIVAAVWTAIAMLFAAHNYLSGVADGRPITLQQAVWWSVAEWYTWALLTPLVVVAVRRTRVAARGAMVSLLTLAVAGVVVAALQIGLEYAGDRAVTLLTGDPGLTVRIWLSDGARGAPLDLAYLVRRKIGFGLATYCAVVIAISALDYYRLYRDRELRAARLEAALTSAQLHALQSQLQPHFLFNTLNSIASLIPDDPEAAEEMVESLSELLRAALHEAGHFEIPLQRELELLDQYVRIQRSRFQDRLHVHFAVERGLETALVPPLILQPIVENAIRHAVALRESGGEIAIRVAECDGALRLTVEDDGPGFTTQSADDGQPGIGLANTRARISQLYGSAARLETTDAAGGGGVVDVWLPVRRLTPDHEPGGPPQSGIGATRLRPGTTEVRTA